MGWEALRIDARHGRPVVDLISPTGQHPSLQAISHIQIALFEL